MAGGRIYHLVGTELVALDETAYDAEAILQRLLAEHPDLLAGDQINTAAPRRWLLMAREAAIPRRRRGCGSLVGRPPVPRPGRAAHLCQVPVL